MKILKALKLKKSVIAAQSLALAFLVSSCASQKQEIVQQVITAQETNGYMLPPSIQGFKLESLNEAYEVQNLYNERKSTTHGPVSGYKIAYASKQSQKANGISEPVYGALFKKQFVPNGGSIKIDDFSGFHIESEITFIIDKKITLFNIDGNRISCIRLKFKRMNTGFCRCFHNFYGSAQRMVMITRHLSNDEWFMI